MDNGSAPIVWVGIIGCAIWVGVDAGKLRKQFGRSPGNTSPAFWVIGTLLLWIVIFPVYLYQRSQMFLTTTTGGVKGVAVHSGAGATRDCPFCKEQMRRDASVCPHCRHASPAWTFHEGRWWFKGTDGSAYWLDETQGQWVRWGPVAMSPPPLPPS
ncbi:MAG: hypothetical protein QOG54_2645 [Actinomycetota bacterium]|nr:hypothetical protein [Actinomycetota bacterium]